MTPEIQVPLTELTSGERDMLRMAMEPEQFLGKVLKKMLDYGEHLTQSLVSVDLLNPDSVNAARKVQATIVAIAWVQETFEQSAADTPAELERTADHE